MSKKKHSQSKRERRLLAALLAVTVTLMLLGVAFYVVSSLPLPQGSPYNELGYNGRNSAGGGLYGVEENGLVLADGLILSLNLAVIVFGIYWLTTGGRNRILSNFLSLYGVRSVVVLLMRRCFHYQDVGAALRPLMERSPRFRSFMAQLVALNFRYDVKNVVTLFILSAIALGVLFGRLYWHCSKKK